MTACEKRGGGRGNDVKKLDVVFMGKKREGKTHTFRERIGFSRDIGRGEFLLEDFSAVGVIPNLAMNCGFPLFIGCVCCNFEGGIFQKKNVDESENEKNHGREVNNEDNRRRPTLESIEQIGDGSDIEESSEIMIEMFIFGDGFFLGKL